jgi:hypothetical protein
MTRLCKIKHPSPLPALSMPRHPVLCPCISSLKLQAKLCGYADCANGRACTAHSRANSRFAFPFLQFLAVKVPACLAPLYSCSSNARNAIQQDPVKMSNAALRLSCTTLQPRLANTSHSLALSLLKPLLLCSSKVESPLFENALCRFCRLMNGLGCAVLLALPQRHCRRMQPPTANRAHCRLHLTTR